MECVNVRNYTRPNMTEMGRAICPSRWELEFIAYLFPAYAVTSFEQEVFP